MSGVSLEKSTILTLYYSLEIDYVGGKQPIYIGLSIPGARTSDKTWQIRKVAYDVNSNPTSVLFAQGSNEFASVWDDRTTYVYS